MGPDVHYGITMKPRYHEVQKWKKTPAGWRFKMFTPTLGSIHSRRYLQRARNWPNTELYYAKIHVKTTFLALAFLYGALHNLAWTTDFHSRTEQLLWRISSPTIMGAGFPMLACYCLLETVYYTPTRVTSQGITENQRKRKALPPADGDWPFS